MDRSAWLADKRRMAEKRMDTLFAPVYDEHWGHINPTHHAMLHEFLDRCRQGGRILDAACGTGKYWPDVVGSGRFVVGLDQSERMLSRAYEKFPSVPLYKRGLQDIDFVAAFDGVTCVDAMKNISPENWPLVLSNFHRALKSHGPLYLTVEITSQDELTTAFHLGMQLGLPIVNGEHAHEGGYHYYPAPERVTLWIQQAGFRLVKEIVGDGYRHYLLVRE